MPSRRTFFRSAVGAMAGVLFVDRHFGKKGAAPSPGPDIDTMPADLDFFQRINFFKIPQDGNLDLDFRKLHFRNRLKTRILKGRRLRHSDHVLVKRPGTLKSPHAAPQFSTSRQRHKAAAQEIELREIALKGQGISHLKPGLNRLPGKLQKKFLITQR